MSKSIADDGHPTLDEERTLLPLGGVEVEAEEEVGAVGVEIDRDGDEPITFALLLLLPRNTHEKRTTPISACMSSESLIIARTLRPSLAALKE